jgi:hypothetical protein
MTIARHGKLSRADVVGTGRQCHPVPHVSRHIGA